jgi:voltage-gated potassium channel
MMDARSQYVQLASKWEEKSNIPMALLGLVYLGTYTAQVLNKENLTLVYQLEIVSVALWVVFAADVLIRLIFSKNVKAFVKSSWLEILALTLPFLRVLRVFRAVIGLRGIKGFVKNRVNATAAYVVMLVPLTWFTGGIAVLDAESNNPDAIISTMREALWWSLATITTVGYGDKYPTTIEGQLVAAVLMLTGIALFSAGAGMFASWILADKKKS